jgi:hypothetical protein
MVEGSSKSSLRRDPPLPHHLSGRKWFSNHGGGAGGKNCRGNHCDNDAAGGAGDGDGCGVPTVARTGCSRRECGSCRAAPVRGRGGRRTARSCILVYCRGSVTLLLLMLPRLPLLPLLPLLLPLLPPLLLSRWRRRQRRLRQLRGEPAFSRVCWTTQPRLTITICRCTLANTFYYPSALYFSARVS